MLTPDQIIAGLLFILGLGAGLLALLQPFAGAVIAFILYLMRFLRYPFPGLFGGPKKP